jgi:Putative Zn-dependent protease, contains TPR repeats
VTALLGEEKERRVALSIMEHLVENYRDNPHAQFALARVAAHAGEPARAKRAVRQALRIKPGWVEAHLLLARLQMQQGDTNQALQTLEKVLSAHPENRDLRLNYAQILVEARRLDEAHREFERLVGQAPNDADMLYVVGILSLQGARLDDAERYLKRLVETGQRQLEGYYYLGRIEESRNHSSEAIKWYSKVRHGEFRIDARTRIAALLAKGGDIAAGRALLQKLRADHPNLVVRLYVAEGEILSESGRGEDAFELYTGALQKLPGDADLLYARALVAEKLNRLDVLEQDLSDILEYDPDNAHALNALGYTLANRTTRYQEALQYIQRALELNPNDHAVIDSMGWVQYRLRNYEEAVKYLRRALSMSQDPEVAAHLGEVLWVKGDQPAAREVWERALQTDPSSEAVLEVMKRFQE